MKKKTIARSSVNGKIVSKKFAKENPSTTQVEIIGTTGIGKKEAAGLLSQINEAIGKLSSVKTYLQSRIK